MSSEPIPNLGNSFSREYIACQIESLGNLASEALDNCNRRSSNDHGLGESWRIGVYKIAECLHVFCDSISSQIVTDNPENDLMYRSIAFQIEAVGDSAVNSLEIDIVKLMGGLASQRFYVEGVTQSIKDFCVSIADQLRSETFSEAE